MAFTHRITITYATNAGTIINNTENVSGTNQGVDIDQAIDAGATIEHDVMIVPDQVQSLLLFSDQPMTIQTNDQNTPTDTITLKASIPVEWTLNSFWPIPFALGTSVTKLFLTNNGPTAANVRFRVLSN